MKRRTFIKGLVGAAVAVALPIEMIAGAAEVPVSIGNEGLLTLDRFGIATKRTTTKMRELTKATKSASAAVEQLGDVIVNGIQDELDGEGWCGIDSFSDHFESDDGSVMLWTTIASFDAAQDGRRCENRVPM